MQSLGTLLRNLIDRLDGAVEQLYLDKGLTFKPRYFPVAKTLINDGPMSIKALAAKTQVSHSAMSQTVAHMKRSGWLTTIAGEDKRERLVMLSDEAKSALPQLREIWRAVELAAGKLNDELPMPIEQTLSSAIDALEQEDFYQRINKELE